MAPYDELSLLADDIIIRRINPNQHIVRDQNTGRDRISSKAFSPSSGLQGGMSVDIEKLIVAAGLDARRFVTAPIWTGSVSFVASQVRALDMWIGFDPLPQNVHHAEVWRAPDGGTFTGTQKRGLQRAAVWYVAIPNTDLA
jgi:hypothetical protein